MTAANRFPTGTTALAAIAGATAWALPYVIKPFLYWIFPFLPNLPSYEAPPYRIDLAELTISFALAGILAGGLFLAGLRLLAMRRAREDRLALSLPIVFSALFGPAIGGAAASLFAYGVGFSPKALRLLFSMDMDPLDKLGPEPFLSAGLIIGAVLAAITILYLSGILRHIDLTGSSRSRIAWGLVLQLSLIGVVTRLIISSVASWSGFTYSAFGDSILFLLLTPLLSGAIFGAWGWRAASALTPA